MKCRKKSLIDIRKTVLFAKFPNFTTFLLPVQSIFKIHKAIFKKIFFLTLLQGIPNSEARIFEKYTSGKKNSFEKKSAVPYCTVCLLKKTSLLLLHFEPKTEN